MPVYMADRDLPGSTPRQLAAAQHRAIEASARLTARGTAVRYLRSVYVPGDARLMCLFEAPDAASVMEVNEEAQIPFLRVVEALDLTPST